MIPPRIRKGDPIGKLADYWNILIDHLNETRLVSGKGISINKMPAGTVINAQNYSQAHTQGQTGNSGPFAVSLINEGSTDNPVMKLLLHDGSEQYGDRVGFVTIGSYREEIKKQTFPVDTGEFFLLVKFENEKLKISFVLDKEMPYNDGRIYTYRIAHISRNPDSDTYTISQIHPYGDIEVVGRWVS